MFWVLPPLRRYLLQSYFTKEGAIAKAIAQNFVLCWSVSELLAAVVAALFRHIFPVVGVF
jgi:hypothetical protein